MLGPYFHFFGLDDSHPFSPMALVAVHKGSPMCPQALAEKKRDRDLKISTFKLRNTIVKTHYCD